MPYTVRGEVPYSWERSPKLRAADLSIAGHYWYTDPATGAQKLAEVRRSDRGTLEVGRIRGRSVVWVPVTSLRGKFQGPVVKPLD